jgi:uncharacterized protein
MRHITELTELRALLGDPLPTTPKKIQKTLSTQMQDFIQQSPLMLLSTIGEDGVPTISPKGDHAGFVRVHDWCTLYIPERKGNNLLVTLQNLLANPRAGAFFIIPNTYETLRVHGNIELVTDTELQESLRNEQGKPALLIMVMHVESAYFHCGKAMIRSHTWEPKSWISRRKISFAQEMARNTEMTADEIAQFDTDRAARYANITPYL